MKLTRRRLFFASILVLGLAVANFVGWRGYRAWQNHRVKVWVESYGGHVVWGANPRTPAFLRQLLGEPIFDEISFVHVSGSFPISLNDVEMLARLPRLEFISLQSNGISDEHVEILSRSRSIQELNLSETAITDRSLIRISKGMPQVRKIHVFNTSVSDRGIDALLTGLPQLEALNLQDTDVSSEKQAEVKRAGIRLGFHH